MIAAGQLTCGTLLVAPVALLVDQPWRLPPPSSSTLLAVFGLALLSTALAYTFYFRILAAAGATNVVLVTFLIPVSTVLLAAAFLGEVVDPGEVAGMALIGLGLAVIDGRLIARCAADAEICAAR